LAELSEFGHNQSARQSVKSPIVFRTYLNFAGDSGILEWGSVRA